MNLIQFFSQLLGQDALGSKLPVQSGEKLDKDFANLLESKGFNVKDAKKLLSLLESSNNERKAFVNAAGIEVSIKYPKHLIKNRSDLFDGLKEQIAKLPMANEVGTNEKPIDKPSVKKGVVPSNLVLDKTKKALDLSDISDKKATKAGISPDKDTVSNKAQNGLHLSKSVNLSEASSSAISKNEVESKGLKSVKQQLLDQKEADKIADSKKTALKQNDQKMSAEAQTIIQAQDAKKLSIAAESDAKRQVSDAEYDVKEQNKTQEKIHSTKEVLNSNGSLKTDTNAPTLSLQDQPKNKTTSSSELLASTSKATTNKESLENVSSNKASNQNDKVSVEAKAGSATKKEETKDAPQIKQELKSNSEKSTFTKEPIRTEEPTLTKELNAKEAAFKEIHSTNLDKTAERNTQNKFASESIKENAFKSKRSNIERSVHQQTETIIVPKKPANELKNEVRFVSNRVVRQPSISESATAQKPQTKDFSTNSFEVKGKQKTSSALPNRADSNGYDEPKSKTIQVEQGSKNSIKNNFDLNANSESKTDTINSHNTKDTQQAVKTVKENPSQTDSNTRSKIETIPSLVSTKETKPSEKNSGINENHLAVKKTAFQQTSVVEKTQKIDRTSTLNTTVTTDSNTKQLKVETFSTTTNSKDQSPNSIAQSELKAASNQNEQPTKTAQKKASVDNEATNTEKASSKIDFNKADSSQVSHKKDFSTTQIKGEANNSSIVTDSKQNAINWSTSQWTTRPIAEQSESKNTVNELKVNSSSNTVIEEDTKVNSSKKNISNLVNKEKLNNIASPLDYTTSNGESKTGSQDLKIEAKKDLEVKNSSSNIARSEQSSLNIKVETTASAKTDQAVARNIEQHSNLGSKDAHFTAKENAPSSDFKASKSQDTLTPFDRATDNQIDSQKSSKHDFPLKDQRVITNEKSPLPNTDLTEKVAHKDANVTKSSEIASKISLEQKPLKVESASTKENGKVEHSPKLQSETISSKEAIEFEKRAKAAELNNQQAEKKSTEQNFEHKVEENVKTKANQKTGVTETVKNEKLSSDARATQLDQKAQQKNETKEVETKADRFNAEKAIDVQNQRNDSDFQQGRHQGEKATEQVFKQQSAALNPEKAQSYGSETYKKVAEKVEFTNQSVSNETLSNSSNTTAQKPVQATSEVNHLQDRILQNIRRAEAVEWNRQRIVMEDGRSLRLGIRKSGESIQLQLLGSQNDLSKLIQQHATEIRAHLEQQLGVKVEMQFGQSDSNAQQQSSNQQNGLGAFGGGLNGQQGDRASDQSQNASSLNHSDDQSTSEIDSAQGESKQNSTKPIDGWVG